MAASASPPKRCLYEILDLPISASPDDIRSAYKKLALLRHPDKLIRSGLSESDATASFQKLQNAYQVLSDPQERSWYDSHRSQILFSAYSTKTTSFSSIPNLFYFFNNSVFSGYSDSGKGFYKVYSDVFDKVYNCEVGYANKMGLGDNVVREAPVLGNLRSDYAQVNAFYGYWLGFVSVMDFTWVDEYDVRDGADRRSRRMMEEENRKLRKRAKKEYNDTVRGLAGFVKKRDKRVVEMKVKRNEEMERKSEEEKRKRELEKRERAERARAFKEEEWTMVEEVEIVGFEVEGEEEEEEGEKREFYCVMCGKKFKSEKQWRNHEQSKKHKEKVAELREVYEEEVEDEEVEGNGFVSADDGLDEELGEKFKNVVKTEEHDTCGLDEEVVVKDDKSNEEEEEVFVDTDDGGELKGVAEKSGLYDDEAMLSGHKSKKNKKGKTKASPAEEVNVEVDDDEKEFMECNNRKSARKNRGSRRRRRADGEGMRVTETSKTDGNSADGATMKGDSVKTSSSLPEENNGREDSSPLAEETTTSQSFVENHAKGKDEDVSVKVRKVQNPAADKKGATKKDTDTKSKTAAKGRKQKTSSKGSSDNTCEKCGADFESRTKLHSHLKDTGHATLKSR